MQDLLIMLDSIAPLSRECKKFLKENLKARKIPKQGHLLHIGEVCREIVFIREGLFRGYSLHRGVRYNVWFMAERDVMISVSSFYTQQPSSEGIQALENSRILSLDISLLQQLYRLHPEFNLIGRVLTEKYYLKTVPDLQRLRYLNGKERYLHFRSQSPQVFYRIPKYHLASYLGIALSSLYRIQAAES